MLRNLENRFAEVPNVDIPRSIFDMSHEHLTSCNVSELIPIFRLSVMPGDTVNLKTSIVARLQTLLTPMMGNLYGDIFYFYEPYRVVWPHWKGFVGENLNGPWANQTQYIPPKIQSPSGGWNKGTIADYLGIPPGVEFKPVASGGDGLMPLALDFRIYADICENWFRDQNVTDHVNVPTGDSNQQGSNGSNYITDTCNGGAPFKVSKFHDYFTSCLPDPQKNRNPVTFPLISGQEAPVYAGNDHTHSHWYLRMKNYDDSAYNAAPKYMATSRTSDSSIAGVYESTGTATIGTQPMYPNNLWADLRDTVGSVTVNQLRLAFQMQKFYEQQARSGSRYREIIKGMFSTTVPDGRVQIPEYLGGSRFPVSVHQVVNSSESSIASLGDLGAMSNTSHVEDSFIKSFTEWGTVLGVMCFRYDHVYSQGLHRDFTRDDYFSWYWPVLANIGEQPVYKYEIDATVRSGENRLDVFGFNEARSCYSS